LDPGLAHFFVRLSRQREDESCRPYFALVSLARAPARAYSSFTAATLLYSTLLYSLHPTLSRCSAAARSRYGQSSRPGEKGDETTKLKRSTWLESRLFVWCKISLAVRRENAQRQCRLINKWISCEFFLRAIKEYVFVMRIINTSSINCIGPHQHFGMENFSHKLYLRRDNEVN
jgi:hypothetical protein